jgi:hypothetical protein
MTMTKRTRTAEEIEWEAGREWRERFIYGRLNATQREMVQREQQEQRRARVSRLRRRLFPWRIRFERL